MRTIIAHDRCVLLHGDSAALGPVLTPESIDAMVTDPPAGIGFMGKAWDKDKGGRDGWVSWLAETLAPSYAALKPGAFGLVWALPRTSHWTAYALEACGFEICDRVSHLFGTGFPKSLNLGKAIDKYLGAERVAAGRGVAACTYLDQGVPYAGHNNGTLQPTVHAFATSAGSPQAAEWEGWGTALKPACEDWWLVQKPFRGTYAENVLAYGVGGLNIDGCRIGEGKQVPASASTKGNTVYGAGMGSLAAGTGGSGFDPNVGRWPAHLVLSHSPDCGDACVEGCAVRLLDEQSGGASKFFKTCKEVLGGLGSASRFKYVAKGSRSEKDAGLDHLPARTGAEATGSEEGQARLDSPGRTGGARNIHPTVKSVALMRWLVRLITPPGGTVLDPFAGSGTTGIAALEEGMSFVGCEQSDEYLPIVEGRLRHTLGIVPR